MHDSNYIDDNKLNELRNGYNNAFNNMQDLVKDISDTTYSINKAIVHLPLAMIESGALDAYNENDANSIVCDRVGRIIKMHDDVSAIMKVIWGMPNFYNTCSVSDKWLIDNVNAIKLEDDTKRIDAAKLLINDIKFKLKWLTEKYIEVY